MDERSSMPIGEVTAEFTVRRFGEE